MEQYYYLSIQKNGLEYEFMIKGDRDKIINEENSSLDKIL
jgi:hypothetical protein